MIGFGRMSVVGESMSPTIKNGDIIYTRPYFFWELVATGDIVVLRDPRKSSRKIIKRVNKITDDSCSVLGDNKDSSSDSRVFGNIKKKYILSRVMFK